MRVLMVTDFFAPHVGGVEVVVESLSRGLAARGHTVTVVTTRTAGLAAAEERDGIAVRRVGSSLARGALLTQRRPWSPPVPDPAAVAGIRAALRETRPDVVHGHDWLARSFLPLRPASDAAFVVSLHYFTQSCAKKSLMYRGAPCSGPGLAKCLGCAGSHYGRARGSAVTLGNFAFAAAERRLVDLFLPVSADCAEGNGVGARSTVLDNPVPPAPPLGDGERSLVEALPREPFALYVGDLRREKGIDVLFAAQARAQGLRLVVVGKRWPDSPAELPPGTTLFEDWPNAAAREAQRRSLFTVVPSVWREPFGMVAAEALAAGRPVIASDIGGLRGIVTDGVDGLLVPPGDAAALAQAMARLAGDDALRERLAANAAGSAARFGLEGVLDRLEAAYARALERRAG